MTVRAGSEAGTFDAGDTSRITRVGRYLRVTKLDELPQHWSVVVADMSLVGPRPEVRKWVEAYPERWAVVHAIRPGITDRAAIVFRHGEELLAASADPERILPRKLDLYGAYVRARSFWGDFVIQWRTFAAVIGVEPAAEAELA